MWREIHLGSAEGEESIRGINSPTNEKTPEIRAAEFTGSDIGDAPMPPEPPDQIPPDREIGSVTADGACDTRECHDAIADRGAAAVPRGNGPPDHVLFRLAPAPRKNARTWKPDTAGAIARNQALRASKYLGRTIWRKRSGYRRRSRAETKRHCMKLLGQRLMARDPARQVAERQVRVAVMHGFTAPGIPVTQAIG